MKQLPEPLKLSLLFCGVAVGLVLALPILFMLAIISRFVLIAGAIVAVVFATAAYLVSGRFRAWVHDMLEGAVNYNGLRLANDVALHPGHAWARVEPDSSEVGVDDLMQAALGTVNRVELPALGQRIERGEQLLRLWHDRRMVDVRSPLGGTVVAANAALAEQPGLINDDPYDRGWVVRMRCEKPRGERRSLFRGTRARAWFRREVDRLFGEALADPELATVLPDGGELFQLDRHLDEAAWERVRRTFFGQERPESDAARAGQAPEKA